MNLYMKSLHFNLCLLQVKQLKVLMQFLAYDDELEEILYYINILFILHTCIVHIQNIWFKIVCVHYQVQMYMYILIC